MYGNPHSLTPPSMRTTEVGAAMPVLVPHDCLHPLQPDLGAARTLGDVASLTGPCLSAVDLCYVPTSHEAAETRNPNPADDSGFLGVRVGCETCVAFCNVPALHVSCVLLKQHTSCIACHVSHSSRCTASHACTAATGDGGGTR